jgi:predicted AAA+ superfamily ATPase
MVHDLLPRVASTNINLLKRVLLFLFDSIGSEISINNIANNLSNRGGEKINPKLVAKFVEGCLDSFLLYSVSRFDLKGKQILLGNEKYYSIDEGLRKVSLGNTKVGSERILENIVYLELRRRGYEVYVGKINNYEIDFVAKKDSELKYFQVAATVLDETTFEREIKPFYNLRDGYERNLLTLDIIGAGRNINGIKQHYVLDWLLDT